MTVSARCPGRDASELGFLMAKHPDRVQDFSLPFGTAWVYYPEVTAERTSMALQVEVDPVGLVRNRRFRAGGSPLSAYVNDRPYAASSLLAVAIKRVLGTALKGTCRARPELVQVPWQLTITLAALGSLERAHDLLTPLGWQVETGGTNTAPARCILNGSHTVSDALSQVYVLLPVLDGSKHYWVDSDEVDKLVTHGGTWLPQHPLRDEIVRGYLAGQRSLITEARQRLFPETHPDNTATPSPLAQQRRDAIIGVLHEAGARRVVDVGCGEGALVAELLADPAIDDVLGLDVAPSALEQASRRLGLDSLPERQRRKVTLAQSSLSYVDERLACGDAVVLSEVIEHIDAERLPALEDAVFGGSPHHVIVTTPNCEYNAHYNITGFRHPDHRFEWTRAQFEAWAGGVASRRGYRVAFRGIGEAVSGLGCPTQLAWFEVL